VETASNNTHHEHIINNHRRYGGTKASQSRDQAEICRYLEHKEDSDWIKHCTMLQDRSDVQRRQPRMMLRYCYNNNTTTTVLRPSVWHYPGEPVPEETLIHPPSWSSSSLYQLLPSTTIHSILLLYYCYYTTISV